jgi:serine/threonine-protein kinase
VERWQQIEEIFQEALLREPAQRDAYVRDACRDDIQLHREVSSMLSNHIEADDAEPWAAAAAAQLVAGQVSLKPGQCLGPYRIESFLAAGGMAEVYRATDTRLHRQVAIKVSAARFSERFETEARVIASLNHPNICQLYDVGPNYLVMELVEGPTLADRIQEGALPVAEALGVARQMAEALEAAHEKGRIHRDLKPANIKITPEGTVKLLDFGLAKALEEPSRADDRSNSPTMTISPTGAGLILGTVAYMSPEQARGSAVDKRTDIWAFGAVLYEMLSGRVAFAGETTSDILAAVLRGEPDWSTLPVSTPTRIRKLLRRCLERDRKQRLRDIGEARIVIDSPEEDQAIQPSRPPWPWLVAGVLAIALAGAVFNWWRAVQPSPPHPAMRLSIEIGQEFALAKGTTQGVLAISPDGGRLVFAVRGADGVVRLATRLLDQSRSTLLAGTENAQGPFFSPNSDWIGFFADGKLKKISVRGGAPVTLSIAPGPRGASWGDDDNIIASLNLGNAGLSRIRAGGGLPTPVTEVSGAKRNISRWPQVLPGSRAVLFNWYELGENTGDAGITVLSFKTGQRKIVERGYFARYLPSGHLVFLRQNTLFAAPFDLDRLAVTATPQPVLDDIGGLAYSGGGDLASGHFDLSRTGTLVYVSGTAGSKRAIFWLDRSGNLQPLHQNPGQYFQPRFSPDGKHLAFAAATEHGIDVWVQDLDRGTASPKSFLPGRNWWPVWTPDGKGIVFSSANFGRRDIYWVRADGSGDAQPLADSTMQRIPRSFAPDGTLAFDNGNEIWTAPMEGGSEHPHLGTAALFHDAATPLPEVQFSPNGRWMAYVSAESGASDVFVRPFPGPGGRRQISIGGGHFPIWSRNGHELFFLGPDQRIRVTEYTASGNSFTPGTPRVWSEKRLGDMGVNSPYDLEPDGKRFAVVLDPDELDTSKPITSVNVLLNFFDEVRRRVAAPSR